MYIEYDLGRFRRSVGGEDRVGEVGRKIFQVFYVFKVLDWQKEEVFVGFKKKLRVLGIRSKLYGNRIFFRDF